MDLRRFCLNIWQWIVVFGIVFRGPLPLPGVYGNSGFGTNGADGVDEDTLKGSLTGDVQNWAMLIQNYILQVSLKFYVRAASLAAGSTTRTQGGHPSEA